METTPDLSDEKLYTCCVPMLCEPTGTWDAAWQACGRIFHDCGTYHAHIAENHFDYHLMHQGSVPYKFRYIYRDAQKEAVARGD
jgi:hypothetical protein